MRDKYEARLSLWPVGVVPIPPIVSGVVVVSTMIVLHQCLLYVKFPLG